MAPRAPAHPTAPTLGWKIWEFQEELKHAAWREMRYPVQPGTWTTWSHVSSRENRLPRANFSWRAFLATWKNLGTKENPTWRWSSQFWEDYKLILVPRIRQIRHLWYQFLLETYFSSFGWVWMQGKWLWRLQNTEMKTTFVPLTHKLQPGCY